MGKGEELIRLRMNRRWAALLIVTVAIIVGTRVAALGPPLIGGDTIRYTGGAAHLLAGEPLVGKESSYLAYLAVVAAASLFRYPLVILIVVQAVVVVLATIIVYRMAHEIRGVPAGITAGALFCFNADVALWTGYVLTDALYLSFVAFAVWSVYRRHWSWPFVVLIAVMLRPNGWLFVPLVVMWFTRRLLERFPARKLLIVGTAAVCLLAMLIVAALPSRLRNAVEAEGVDDALRKGVLIWGWPEWNLSMPADAASGGGWPSAVQYVWRHPVASAKLAFTRVAVEVMHVRPHYPKERTHDFAILPSAVHTGGDRLVGDLCTSIVANGARRCHRTPVADRGNVRGCGRPVDRILTPILSVYAGCAVADALRESLERARLKRLSTAAGAG